MYRKIKRKVCTLLYFVHRTTYNQINWKLPHVVIMHSYRLVWFHTQGRFCDRISVRVSNSCHPVTYSKNVCTNKPGYKIYCCMSEDSIRNHTVLHNPTIIHTNTFFAPACNLRKKILSKIKLWQSPLIHSRSPKMSLSTSKYDSNTNSSQNIYLFTYLGLELKLGLSLRSNHSLDYNRYISLHATTGVSYYFIPTFFTSTIILTNTGEC